MARMTSIIALYGRIVGLIYGTTYNPRQSTFGLQPTGPRAAAHIKRLLATHFETETNEHCRIYLRKP
jgi:hypothetical protein